jgi:hypothetical protein
MIHSRSRLVRVLLATACLVAPACRRTSEAPVAQGKSISDTNAAAREARRANEELRSSRGDMVRDQIRNGADVSKDSARAGSADTTFLMKRDQVVGQARTSLAAMDQKIAELETYAKAGHVKDAHKAEVELAALRDERRVAAAALDDLAIADADDWDTRRVDVEKAFADLDGAYKDARDVMSPGATGGHDAAAAEDPKLRGENQP